MTKSFEDNPPKRGAFTAAALSIAIHAMLVGLALIPWATAPLPRPKLIETTVLLYTPSNLVLNLPKDAGKSGGGGGGGKRQLTPASLGRTPRGADKQLAPPDPELPKNPKWRFRPAMQNGKAVDSILNIEVSFNLR